MTRLGLGLAPTRRPVQRGRRRAARTPPSSAPGTLGLRLLRHRPALRQRAAPSAGPGARCAAKPRDEFALSTKVGRLLVPGGGDGQEIWAEPAGVAPVCDFSADGVRRSLSRTAWPGSAWTGSTSLHLHDPDEHYAQAVGAGPPGAGRAARRRAASAPCPPGMNQAAMLTEFARTGDFDCFLLAGRYTLLDQSGLADLLPLCAARGISVIAGGVYNSGLLADPRPGATYDYAPAAGATARPGAGDAGRCATARRAAARRRAAVPARPPGGGQRAGRHALDPPRSPTRWTMFSVDDPRRGCGAT